MNSWAWASRAAASISSVGGLQAAVADVVRARVAPNRKVSWITTADVAPDAAQA